VILSSNHFLNNLTFNIMATFKKNSLTKGVSGSFGDEFVFRQVNGKTIIAPLPAKSGKVSEKQAEARARFLNASLYAKSAMANPAMKAEYEAIAKHKNFRGGATVAAMTDYLTSTHLAMAYAHQFDGSTGFPVTLVLADNYKGKEMAVSISNKDGTIAESGKANFALGDSAWTYITTVPYANIDGLTVKVTVKDRIGRVSTFEKELNSEL
jgi:hypothetical protein